MRARVPRPSISVVIPTIAPRREMLDRAIESVHAQTLKAHAIIIVRDDNREGAPRTRQRGLDEVRTRWVAFLDDDDYLYPEHLESLYECAVREAADYVYPWFDCTGEDPFPKHEGQPFNPLDPVQTTITVLCKTRLARRVGFLRPPPESTPDGNRSGEDWAFTKGCVAVGAKIVHLNRRTWMWDHHAGNTSGLPSKW